MHNSNEKSRPGKSVRCSLDPEYGFKEVPQFNFHNLFKTLNTLNRNVPKGATWDNLWMICSLTANLVSKPEICGRLRKMFLNSVILGNVPQVPGS